ncbi:MAG: hypothetical protein ACRELT_16775, partial [Longimicrobiales bacterium]
FNAVLPLGFDGGVLRLGSWRSSVDSAVLDEMSLLFGADPLVELIPEDEGRAAITRVYGADSMTAEDVIAACTSATPRLPTPAKRSTISGASPTRCP